MIRVQSDLFDMGAELNRFAADAAGAGAVVSFSGLVRDVATGDLSKMIIEHYPGMTEKALGEIADQARFRWSLTDVFVLHRYGEMTPGEPIMMVATAARHRADAFAAAEFLMDYLKSRAPFWKQEIAGDKADWVAARDEDEAALKRW
ncbi:molybdenum cofactor biosynthesis protein MoaE [Roseobacter sp. HKCCD9010]|uniref:molybdenum cofactor biosynthesis protein MoaE n=1 Tax=unclassified Roseobacter TaxID=196798 RepID=UPI0014914A62|nr:MULTISPECIES: molybdenum cofactor biosynthesis protein MoaE [unclassified Roseobacter]MBF9048692.1 molybdenum cofactor biosynthesis protein MoaE [Rhodobacterales bacterium HKCCD4356]NNV10691.1 molybdenum cofactor biosynthesis protein MoaE [Roseobacter sp. HKCCD7357]NNV14876.1 molybdenum cofactor biosynthesis protein MoaE [Roseobacter sp. HKCCD8768]NNV24335.1 molybdenum cofactor biosynthesis protein MoaE [Roseobacter sp. HKCCD8192]NNV28592.1 molybdenum cofactor biosynthesis protein MoaE [Ros